MAWNAYLLHDFILVTASEEWLADVQLCQDAAQWPQVDLHAEWKPKHHLQYRGGKSNGSPNVTYSTGEGKVMTVHT